MTPFPPFPDAPGSANEPYPYVLLQTQDRNPVYLFAHSRALYPLSQRFGTPDSRQFIQGADMILYKDLQETASTPQP